ncbi:hypothetical protein HY991_05790 [Candidatus Micrarchaeota archaeon]|nr:hypothetical protein [Candidatus Micrarchaeota archaeon]
MTLDISLRKRVRGEPRVLLVRLYRNVPTEEGFEVRDYLKDVPRELVKRFLLRDRVFNYLYRISRQRERQGMTPALNLAAAIAHAVQAMRMEPAPGIQLIRQIMRQPTARRRFERSLLNYIDEKTYSGRLAALDRELKNHFSGKFTFADVGCSHGHTTEDTKAAFHQAKVVGYEKSFPPDFTLARKKAVYDAHDILAGPLKIKCDVVRCSNVFPHLTDDGQRKALEHLTKSVKEGGILIVDDLEKHKHNFYIVKGGRRAKRIASVTDPDYVLGGGGS